MSDFKLYLGHVDLMLRDSGAYFSLVFQQSCFETASVERCLVTTRLGRRPGSYPIIGGRLIISGLE